MEHQPTNDSGNKDEIIAKASSALLNSTHGYLENSSPSVEEMKEKNEEAEKEQ